MAPSDAFVDDTKVGTKHIEETNLIEGNYLKKVSDLKCSQLSSRIHHITTGDMERNRLIVLCGFCEFSSEIGMSCCEKCLFQKLVCL